MRTITLLFGYLLGALMLPNAAQASLLGDRVEAHFEVTSLFAFLTVPFDATSTVGPGTEFSGVMVDIIGNRWTFDLDVGAGAFSLDIGASNPDAPIAINNVFPVVSFFLNDLDWLGHPGEVVGVALAEYTCATPGQHPCNADGGGPYIFELGYGPDSVAVVLGGVRDGERYEFDILTRHAVPLPGTVLLLLTGLLAGAAARQRRA